MTSPTPAERALFADLTRLFLSMRDSSLGDVEASIEERFRSFVRAQAGDGAGGGVSGLQITFTWTLPDGADDWAVYRTEYKTVPAEPRALPQCAAIGGGASAVIEFPSQQQITRPTPPNATPARIIAFPGR